MPAITEIARAKVNLTLKVRGRRPDGYHELESLVVFATDLGDVVRFIPGEEIGCSVRGPFAAAIEGDNLIDRALARLAEQAPQLKLGEVTLEKTLPVAAGIGGGSADAAALLRAVRFANGSLSAGVDWAGNRGLARRGRAGLLPEPAGVRDGCRREGCARPRSAPPQRGAGQSADAGAAGQDAQGLRPPERAGGCCDQRAQAAARPIPACTRARRLHGRRGQRPDARCH